MNAFFKSEFSYSHSWQRGPNPLFYEDPPTILSTLLFFKFCPTLYKGGKREGPTMIAPCMDES